jgi:hypothetical protein
MYLFSAPNSGTAGAPKILRSDDAALADRWIKAEDRPGFGVYYCPNPLKPGATKHGRDSVAAIECIFVDVDLKDVVDMPDQVVDKLGTLLLEPTEIVSSGHGYHIVYRLKEPVACDDPEFESVCALQAKLIEYFAADPQVRPWSLLRLPGTINSKSDPHVPCEVVRHGPVVDLSELRDMVDIIAENTLLTRKPKPATNGHDTGDSDESAGPVDIDAEWAALEAGKNANIVHCRIIPSMLRKGEHPAEVEDYVVRETMAMAERRGLGWKHDVEVAKVRERVKSTLNNAMMEGYDPATGVIPDWLPGEFHEAWIARISAGQRPAFDFDRVRNQY